MEARLQYMSMINKSCIYCGILRGKEGIYGWIIYRKIQNIDRNLIRWTNRLVAELINEGVGNSVERNYFSEHKE